RATAAPRNSASPTSTCTVGGQPATVTVTPSSASVIVGFTTPFSASAGDAQGNAVTTTFTWTSSDEHIATVDASTGVVTGVAAGGPVTITATTPNNVFGTASVTVNPVPPTASVVISQVYGGGGNSGATFTNDYVELFNAGTTTADVTGYTIQYSSATGTS